MAITRKTLLIINQSNQITDLQNQVADLTGRYATAASQVGQVVQLPTELNDALKGFADAYPDLVEFDATRGIVKFKSDVTFSHRKCGAYSHCARAPSIGLPAS